MSLLDLQQQEQAANAVEGGLLEEGVYKCRIVGVEEWKGTSLVWKYRVEPGQDGAGRELWAWTPLTEKGIWRTKELFAALGKELDADETAFLGMPVVVTVELGTNSQTGAAKNEVVDVVRGEGEAVAEAAPGDGDDGIPF